MRICQEDGDEMGIQYDSGECFDPGDGLGAQNALMVRYGPKSLALVAPITQGAA